MRRSVLTRCRERSRYSGGGKTHNKALKTREGEIPGLGVQKNCRKRRIRRIQAVNKADLTKLKGIPSVPKAKGSHLSAKKIKKDWKKKNKIPKVFKGLMSSGKVRYLKEGVAAESTKTGLLCSNSKAKKDAQGQSRDDDSYPPC